MADPLFVLTVGAKKCREVVSPHIKRQNLALIQQLDSKQTNYNQHIKLKLNLLTIKHVVCQSLRGAWRSSRR